MLLHVCLKNCRFFPWYTSEPNGGVAINHRVVLFYLAIFFQPHHVDTIIRVSRRE